MIIKTKKITFDLLSNDSNNELKNSLIFSLIAKLKNVIISALMIKKTVPIL